jgi:hypothetical protein
MLLNIKTGYNGITRRSMSEIVIMVTSVHRMGEMGIQFVMTDRHAALNTAEFSDGLAGLRKIDWNILQARDFKRDANDLGKVERYQAEALIHKHLPTTALGGIICHGSTQREHIDRLAERASCEVPVRSLPGCYV